jgi:diadenylate cyclase
LILGLSIGFLRITWVDVIDILLVSFLLFQVYKLMRGSIAIKVFLGFLSLYLIYLVVDALEMKLLSTILGQFMGVGVIAALILFQQEIRKFLLLIGKTTPFNNDSIFRSLPWKKNFESDKLNINPVIEAAKTLGSSNTGALIVFAKSSELKFYAESGDLIDAIVSKRLLISIFNKHSPLHDGAVIIAKNRVKAARCVLPVSESESLPASYGLRHRAALGLTEVTDAIVLVVSEETGQISIARNGVINSNLSIQEIRTKLTQYLTDEEESLSLFFTKKEKKEPERDFSNRP